MEVNSQNLQTIGQCLLATLNPSTQKQAEQQLIALQTSMPDFAVKLLILLKPSVLAQCSLPTHVDFPAVLLLKNLIRQHWMNIDSPLFTAEIRQTVKRDIFSYLPEASNNVKIQLSEIISTVASQDYPENWSDLIDRLLERISPIDFTTNLTILKTCHYVFKRYREEERSDDLYREINYTMSKFGPALFQIYVGIEGVLQSNVNDKQQLTAVVQNAIYVNKIFYSLSFQDIPQFIEENLSTFMRILMFLFTFDAPLLQDINDEQPGLLEKLSSSVAKIVILYANKYEEDFTSLTDFAKATWDILTTRVMTAPKHDKLACTCIGFLASVARQERHKGIFDSTLQIICDKIILPNMTIRESDLEIFEDEPIEYIKRDTEGSSDVSTRNSSAVLLVRNLMEFFELEMTKLLFSAVGQSLSDYSANPTRNWRSKILATQLFSAIGARGFTEAFGVTRINPLLNLSEFFSTNILADLQPNNEGLHPLIKLEAIKFVTQYRNQLEKADLSRTLPLLLHHLESKNYIIHTYAALAVERILAVKRGGEAFISSADLSVIVGKMLVTILALIFNHRTLDKMCENYFLIKAFMRVATLAEAKDVGIVAEKFSDRFLWLAGELVKNPMNPLFNHYFFESVALLIKATTSVPEFSSSYSRLESQLVPLLFGILQAEQSDFFPYAFQLFALLTESNPQLPEYIKLLLPALNQPVLWAVPCNTPALVRFLQACLSHSGARELVLSSFEGFITVFRLLLNSKANEAHAFALISALFVAAPSIILQQYLRPVFMLCLTRVQSHKSQRLCSSMLLFFSLLLAEDKISGADLIQLLQQIQPRLYVMLIKSLFLPSLPIMAKHPDQLDRKCVVSGFGKLLVTLHPVMGSTLTEEASLWTSSLSELILVACAGEQVSALADLAVDEVSTSQGAFNRLSALPKARKYSIAVESLPSTEVILAQIVRPILNDQVLSQLSESARVQLILLLQKY